MKYAATMLALAFVATGTAYGQYALQFGSSVAVDGNDVLIGEGRNLLQAGSVFVYAKNDDGSWSESSIKASDNDNEGDGFGRSIAVSSGVAAIGAPSAGLVYLYEKSDGGWTQAAKIGEGESNFGAAVAITDRHLVVGQRGSRETAGAVHTYMKSEDGAWNHTGMLTSGGDPGAGYGVAVAIHGDHLVVGAPNTNGRTGAVYAYTFKDDTGMWGDADSLQFRGLDERDGFGSALQIVGMHLVVGVPGYESGVGAVALYRRDEDADTWEFSRRLAPFDATGEERFGSSIGYSNGYLMVGAPGYSSRDGAVYSFATNAETGRMSDVMRFAPDDLQFRSTFGSAIAANDNVMVVGSVGQDNFEGGAFVYSRTGDMWSDPHRVVNSTGEYASVTGGEVKCDEGEAGSFTCESVDMLSFLSREDIGANRGIQVNDVWGWTDPQTDREFAIVGRTDGTSFIELTDPYNPIYLGELPKTETANQSLWRDIKVYKDHAFIVADGAGAHHLQIFDLKQLRDVPDAPKTFSETAIYKGIYSSHNIAINEETGFAYAVGSDSGGETCGGALHMINVQDPANPTFAGCFNDPRTGRNGSGATHDTQCVTYKGPDVRYSGREICLSSNGTALSIADVTDKENPEAIAVAEYPNVAYTHQGWLTDDHRYFYLNDEGDEVSGLVDATRTVIFDLTELDDPTVAGEYKADNNAIDHNLYIKGNLMYQANYSAGLRILDISDPANPEEVAFFDTVPYGKNDNSPVLGAWSNYPYFESGVIVVSSGREGVFFLKKKEIEL